MVSIDYAIKREAGTHSIVKNIKSHTLDDAASLSVMRIAKSSTLARFSRLR